MKNTDRIKEYFEEIKDDTNYADITLVEKLPSRKKGDLYEYLKHNHILYAGGEIDDGDIVKVRNVMINLWLKATENNKKYSSKR